MSLGRLLSSGKSLVGLSSSRYQLRTDSLPKFKSAKNPFAARPVAEPGDAEKLSPAEMAAANLKKTQRIPLLPPKPATPDESFQPTRPAETRVKPPVATPAPHEAKPAIPSPVLNRNSQEAQSPSNAGSTSASPMALRRSEAKAEGWERAGVRASDKGEKSESSAVIGNWLKKLNPLVWFGDRKSPEIRPSVPRFDKKPVQGELSLENIKVMRNDLSDADVEVVPKKALPMQDIPLSGASAAAMAIPELPPATSAWEYLGERLLRNH